MSFFFFQKRAKRTKDINKTFIYFTLTKVISVLVARKSARLIITFHGTQLYLLNISCENTLTTIDDTHIGMWTGMWTVRLFAIFPNNIQLKEKPTTNELSNMHGCISTGQACFDKLNWFTRQFQTTRFKIFFRIVLSSLQYA